ncbi:hypothetical protein ACQ4PT_057925 [Festuca glaucescens]
MEPYVVAHHLLFAHASMVSLYRRKYQAVQGGRIGITLLAWWYEPATTKPEDVAAAERMNDFTLGWFLHPLVYGDYPPVMKRNAGSKLPALTAEESARVRGSFDFVGVNQYGAIYVADDPSQLKRELRDYSADEATKYVTQPFESSRHQEFKQRGLGLRNDDAPWALRKLLEHLQTKYANPPVVIYENGNTQTLNPSSPIDESCLISEQVHTILHPGRSWARAGPVGRTPVRRRVQVPFPAGLHRSGAAVYQERVERAQLLRLVLHGLVRVHLRLPVPVRSHRRRLWRRGEDEVRPELGKVVRGFPPWRRAQDGGAGWLQSLVMIDWAYVGAARSTHDARPARIFFLPINNA